MKEFKEVLAFVAEEMESAEEYAGEAAKHREQYPELAALYFRCAVDCDTHAEILCKHAWTMVEACEQRHSEHALWMRHVWEYAREMRMKRAEHVKHLLDMYKG
jgi:hypothetical protein